MRVKNVSARLHVVGGVSIIPGMEADIPDSWGNAIDKNELVEVKVKKEVVAEDVEFTEVEHVAKKAKK